MINASRTGATLPAESRARKADSGEAEAFAYIIELIYTRCRIKLHEGKEQLIKARLGKRMRYHGIDTLEAYCDFLRTQADEEEFTRVVDALTTNFTHFLREEDHFRFMVDHAIPAVVHRGQRRINVWSAACSSGEETYTIGMYLAEHYPVAQGWDWRITGSDISTKVLASAERGIYTEERVQAIPTDWLRKYFQKGVGHWTGHYKVKPDLSERIRFHQINLVEGYQHQQKFEVIFCRNVMIYFDRSTQEQLVTRLCEFLVPNGYLLIGHSESLTGLKVPLRCLRPSVYQCT